MKILFEFRLDSLLTFHVILVRLVIIKVPKRFPIEIE